MAINFGDRKWGRADFPGLNNSKINFELEMILLGLCLFAFLPACFWSMSFGRGKRVSFSNSGLRNEEWRPGILRPKTVKATQKGRANENKAKNKSKRHEERPFECGELRHTGMIPSFFCFFFTEVSIQTSG